ncbi:SGT1 protein-domain-containing protein [Jimgerdemannia flammicorona]|uniref:SGT1 protein-domain-containing protein n=1 Tax=Jimgerdemannia flammicorona TaxID=994334 RepID=A0A433DCH3_9FUNG|nr:SGT1 protein-domain-containing protein [Jimgerdemannia flammicorona]
MLQDQENCVQYSIYFPLPNQQPQPYQITLLQETCALVISHVQCFLIGHLWQKDPFSLQVTLARNGDPAYPFLHGQTRFGDCIDDEWLIVFLLREISIKFKEAIISVSDNDGEFLLIEAAMELPNWLDPSNSQNRVYIHQGKLHIIPLPKTPAEIMQIPTGKLTRQRAIELVRVGTGLKTESETKIYEAAFERIRGYPDEARANDHRARCLVPRFIVYLARREPQLVAQAVEAFCTRDPISMKACVTMTKFPPSTSVSSVIRLTRTLYAQLVGQQLHAPKSFKMPPMSDRKRFKEAELGMKLVVAISPCFPIRTQGRLVFSVIDAPEIGSMPWRPYPYVGLWLRNPVFRQSYPFDSDPQWGAFRHSLTRRGYFRGELEGSRLYRELEGVAKNQYFQNKKAPVNTTTDSDSDSEVIISKFHSATLPPRRLIDRLLSSYSETAPLPPLPDDGDREDDDREDDDSWMNVDPRQLEDMLKARVGGVMRHEKERDGQEVEGSSLDLMDMAGKFEKFVEWDQSGVEGAEFPGELENDDGEEYDSMDEGQEDGDEDKDEAISFNPNEFLNIMRKTLGISDDKYLRLAAAKSAPKGSTTATIPMTTPAKPTASATSARSRLDKVPAPSTKPAEPHVSFAAEIEKISSALPPSTVSTSTLESYMASMDHELGSHAKIAGSFTRLPMEQEGEELEEDETRPVDLKLNLVKNMLESFKSQEGLPGPAESLLGRFGVLLLRDEGEEEMEAGGSE